ncbi:MAG: hypothetical protein LYZ66_00870 [Nitrososphaerales archaeon]|nr:hypothetical protein [Nitrososphaerales archaeon]
MTVKEIVELEDELDSLFRRTIADTKGLHKGVIKEAFEEAIKAWIEKNRKKK